MVGGRRRCLGCFLTYGVGLLLGVCLHNVETSNAKQVMHKKVGDSVELLPNLSTEGVTRADWKYGDSTVADKDSGVYKNHQFQDRLEFNKITFSLTVKKLTLQDSGEFSFVSDVNNKQRSTVFITLQVHEPLTQQPVVTSNISQPDSDGNCRVSLECKSADTNVSFNWTVENQIYRGPSLQHNINLQDGATTFTCTVFNGVSEKSESITETCGNKGKLLVWIVAAAGGGLLILIIITVVCVCLCKRRWAAGSDSNELTVYADVNDFAVEDRTAADAKPCSLYDVIENRTQTAVRQGPQTVYDKIQLGRMRKPSESPYQEVS